MPVFNQQRRYPFTAQQLFSMVADVESYPHFVPWCDGAAIIGNKDNIILARLDVGFPLWKGHYTSRVTLDHQGHIITVELDDGPFHHLRQSWSFEKDGEACLVNFNIDFEMKSKLLQKIIKTVFDPLCHKMMVTFETRAKRLYQN